MRQSDLLRCSPNIDECRQLDGEAPSGNRSKESFGCVWANDNDRYACRIYRKHWDDGTLQEGDIRAVDASAIPEHDLLCAGFPCQSFSIAGKRRGFEDTRGTLFFEICRVLRAKRPGYVFLENVRGLLSHDDGATFETILGALDELGYDCQWQVLNSKDYGVPQNRERVFVVGHIRGQPRPEVFPIRKADTVYSEIATCLDSNYGKGWLDYGQRTMIQLGLVGEKDGMGQRIYASEGIASSLRGEGGGQGGKTGLYAVGWSKSHRTGKSEADKRRKNYGQVEQRIKIGEFNTLSSGDGGGNQSTKNFISDGMKIRRLTPLECERLQGFPDGWTEGISDTQRYKCLGNAVTTNVIEAIGKGLLEELGGQG